VVAPAYLWTIRGALKVTGWTGSWS
jgi:hypothetical protein